MFEVYRRLNSWTNFLEIFTEASCLNANLIALSSLSLFQLTFYSWFMLDFYFISSWCCSTISLATISVTRTVVACYQRTSRRLSRSEGVSVARDVSVRFRWLYSRVSSSNDVSIACGVVVCCRKHSKCLFRARANNPSLSFKKLLGFLKAFQ